MIQLAGPSYRRSPRAYHVLHYKCYPSIFLYSNPLIHSMECQVAVDILLGLDDSWTEEKNLEMAHRNFIAWVEGLFSLPLNLPGTGKLRVGAILWMCVFTKHINKFYVRL